MPIIFNPAPIVASNMAMHSANMAAKAANRRRKMREEAELKEKLAKAVKNVDNKEENKK